VFYLAAGFVVYQWMAGRVGRGPSVSRPDPERHE